MPENSEDEKLESSRVEVSLGLLLKGAKKGYTIDELVDDLNGYVIATYLSVLLAAGLTRISWLPGSTPRTSFTT